MHPLPVRQAPFGLGGGRGWPRRQAPTHRLINMRGNTKGKNPQRQKEDSLPTRQPSSDLPQREEGGGGGWDPKVCIPKMAQQDFPSCNFRVFPSRPLWSGEGGLTPLPQYRGLTPLLLRVWPFQSFPGGGGPTEGGTHFPKNAGCPPPPPFGIWLTLALSKGLEGVQIRCRRLPIDFSSAKTATGNAFHAASAARKARVP